MSPHGEPNKFDKWFPKIWDVFSSCLSNSIENEMHSGTGKFYPSSRIFEGKKTAQQEFHKQLEDTHEHL